MKNRMSSLYLAASLVAMPFLLVGCDNEVSRTGSTSISSDGSSKTKQDVITQSDDGTVTRDETKTEIERDGEATSKTKTTTRAPDGTVTKEETKTSTPPFYPEP